ncbi:haloacid dehalogenase superfamily, subfamily IA, variant 3 with third motif having DD or ED [Methanolobus vulcani]|uniref:Haloacid dehalogenase superfamily, subfamily IA, variant 3 with third motif having DD or ED n=1 Tax=Methanolobus vulcani TaxID=38026 RepID=A0A7Z7FDP3_9EURY|nr:HAD family phosphatase [Methanolobus vulcani]SDG35118.1 haloacid dehalogenase superfamily, subfamily IA, variant 3 with third motif having DD or ED [Methanolobus vulcani]
MIEALIFDMDGVLIDSMHLHAMAWKTAFMEEGISIDERDIFALEGENDTGIVKRVLVINGNNSIDMETILTSVPAKKHQLFDRNSVTLFDGVDDILRQIKGKFKLAVVSGSDRKIVEMMMEKYFPGIFDVVVSGDDTEYGKPAPDPYNKAVEMLGISKDNCIVVENATLGVESANNAGIFTVGLPTYLTRKELEHADIVLHDHEELFRLIELLMRMFPGT